VLKKRRLLSKSTKQCPSATAPQQAKCTSSTERNIKKRTLTDRVVPKPKERLAPKKRKQDVLGYFDPCEADGDNFGPDEYESDGCNEYNLNDPIIKNQDEPESQSQEASQASEGNCIFLIFRIFFL